MIRRLIALGLVLGACVATPAPSRTPAATRPAASPSPTVTVAASPTASASPTVTPIPQNVRFGLVLLEAGPPARTGSVLRLRTEGDAAPFATFACCQSAPVVSPDGTRLAYWDHQQGSTMDFLLVIDLFTGTSSQVVGVSDDVPVGVAWRDDGGGLLFAVRSRLSAPSGGVDPPPATSTVGTYTFATKQIVEVKKIEAARFLPISWSLAAHVVAGVDSSEGRVRKIYRFKEDGTSAGDTPPDERLHEVSDVSKDAKTILAQYASFTGGRSFSGVRTYSALDPSPVAEHVAAEGALLRARFRPSSNDVVALLRVGDPSRYALETWSGAELSTVKRVWNGPAAPVGSGDLLMRIDGKAAYVRLDQAGAAGPTWQVIDLASGSAGPLALPATVAAGPWSSFYIPDEGIAKLRKP